MYCGGKTGEKRKENCGDLTETVLSDTNEDLFNSQDRLEGSNQRGNIFNLSPLHLATIPFNKKFERSRTGVTYVWNKPKTLSYCDKGISNHLDAGTSYGKEYSSGHRCKNHRETASCSNLANTNHLTIRPSDFKQTNM